MYGQHGTGCRNDGRRNLTAWTGVKLLHRDNPFATLEHVDEKDKDPPAASNAKLYSSLTEQGNPAIQE
jgi:hypothetical protein